MRTMLLLLGVTLAAGCKKKDDAPGDKTEKGDKGEKADMADLPALTADPDPGKVEPKELPPFESVKFRMLGKRSTGGWPEYDAHNLGTKVIEFMAITGYAYDKDGKQVARTSPPLSWNGKIEPGDKSSFPLKIGGPGDKLPSTAASYELCVSGISFTGDKGKDDSARCPQDRKKGG